MSTRFHIVVTDFITEPLDPERRILGDLARVTAANAVGEEQLLGKIEDADAIMLYHLTTIRAGTIQRLEKCRLIVRCGVGYDNVDVQAARAKGIAVANVPDYGTEDVADTAIAMMLTLCRGVHTLNARLQARRGPWLYTQVVPLRRLRGATFGVVGLGRIGAAAALRAKALGMDVAFFDPYAPDGRDRSLGVRRFDTLHELLAHSHVVSAHTPLTAETRHLIDAAAIARMPRGSYLINTARGAVVDADALLPALESGHLAGAGIDVLEIEPPSDDHPLLRAWRDPDHPAHSRLILNPHSAFYTEEGRLDMRIKGSQNVRRALLGEPIRNIVN
jgi:D-3-phosphoglycerate dehydrogenase/C-terminal binding protein